MMAIKSLLLILDLNVRGSSEIRIGCVLCICWNRFLVSWFIWWLVFCDSSILDFCHGVCVKSMFSMYLFVVGMRIESGCFGKDEDHF